MQLQYVMSTTREGNKRDNTKSRLMSITTMTRLTSSKRAWMPWSGYTCIWERERERERERSNRESVCVCVCGKHWEHHNCPMKEKSCVIQQHVGHFKEVCDSANLSLTPYTTTGVSHTHTHTHTRTHRHTRTHTYSLTSWSPEVWARAKDGYRPPRRLYRYWMSLFMTLDTQTLRPWM